MTADVSLAHQRARLDDLESRIAYQEHWLDTLDQAVAAQEQRLSQLERISDLIQRRLREQQQALQAGDDREGGWQPEEDRPPHY
ncbi:SlyX family protein [Litchfieldella rifensis]|uniref:SlyX family protein n=1 Tax=Litchfieldella rifensis TaxID=762643 RepID=A0ABV7LPP5_9GAMM